MYYISRMDSFILTASVSTLFGLYQKGEVSPVETVRACLARIFELNPVYNAFCFVDEKETLRQAAASERRWLDKEPLGPLDGAPVTIKDWFGVEGWPTRYGSATSGSAPSETDSPPVARLKEAGAVLLGKTTLPEYGHKGVTDSPLTGITRNPWNRDKTPGGSSGGAAVAAAIGAGPLHLGSDAGGSIRIPSSFTGVFGIKPTPGLVPSWPASLFASLSSAGPMTRTVMDAALMLSVITRPDARDANALPVEKPDFTAFARPTGRRLKILYAPTVNDTPVIPEVAMLVKKAAQALSGFHDVEEIRLSIPNLIEIFNRHWGATAAFMVSNMSEEKKEVMDKRFLEWAGLGAKMPLLDYVWAQRERLAVIEQMKKLLDGCDVLITPATAMTAFDVGNDMPIDAKGERWRDWTPFTYIANLAKLPAASIPCGLTKAGLPVGLQIMAGFLKDAVVFEAAASIEKIVPFKGWLGSLGAQSSKIINAM